METNNLSETLRKYANRWNTDVVFKCVLLEAAERLDRYEREFTAMEQESHQIHRSMMSKQTY